MINLSFYIIINSEAEQTEIDIQYFVTFFVITLTQPKL